jgi:hypothetical protein
MDEGWEVGIFSSGEGGSRGVSTVSAEIHIDRPPAEVFEYASNQRNRGRLLPDNFSDFRLLSEHSAGLGARIAFTIHMDRGSYESITEVIGFDPPEHFVERTTDGDATYETHWRFTSQNGGTLVTSETRYAASPRWAARIIERLVGRRMMRQSLMVELIRLRLALEQP